MPTRPFPFLMGSDPEFSLTIQGQRAHAQNTLSHFVDREHYKSSDGFRTPEMKGYFGWDGCSATAELRPDPAKTPGEHAENIRTVLTGILPKLPCFDTTTLSLLAPIGGHVHLDLPKGDETEAGAKRLHRQLMSFYLPVMLGENPVSSAVRIRNYGQMYDYHRNSFGKPDGKSVYTLEVRSPSAEWLTSPKVAKATLAYLGTVWAEVTLHPKKLQKFKNIILKNSKQMEALQTLVASDYSDTAQKIFAEIRKAVRTFDFYPDHKEDIEFVLNPKAVLKEKQKYGYDIRKGWGFAAKTAVNQKTFFSKKAIDAANEKNGLSLDFAAKNMGLPYNKDVNVESFAVALSERMAALGWKPKNDYYFFGLKKGSRDSILVANEENKVEGGATFRNATEAEKAEASIGRMAIRAREAYDRREYGIDANGKIVRVKRPIVLIGLPSLMRERHDVKSALQAVWRLEKTEKPDWKPCTVAVETAGKDVPEPTETISLAETVRLGETTDLVDRGSQGRQMAETAVMQVAMEQREDLIEGHAGDATELPHEDDEIPDVEF